MSLDLSCRLLAAGAAASAVLVTGGTALAAPAAGFSGFQNIDHTTGQFSDPQFNQALGINDKHVIAGYAGDLGTDNKPNKGWVVTPPYAQGNFKNENVPNSAQTQVVGINNRGQTVGFWVDAHGHNFGFLKRGSLFTTVPGTAQLLGVNNAGAAVGFATQGGNSKPVKCTFTASSVPVCARIVLPGHPANATATGINDAGDIAGFITNAAGRDSGFVLAVGGTFWQPTRLGDNKGTMVFGISNADTVVGSFTAGPATHGFVAQASPGGTRPSMIPTASATR
jgi:hypothetical protein